MRTNHGMLKQITKLGFLLMMGVSMSADAGLFGHTMSWKEEVLLHDGSKIIAERHYNLGGYPAIESQERAALDVTVTFNLLGTNKKIIWKTDYDQAKPEPNSLNLIRLDVVKGVPYIATYPAGCIAISLFNTLPSGEVKWTTIREFMLPQNQGDSAIREEISPDQQLHLFKYTHESDDDAPSHIFDIDA